MEFAIKNENEITMPAGLIGSPLTLDEIGAIFCLCCIDAPKEQGGLENRMESPAMLSAMKSLKERGILTVSVNGNAATVRVNLNVIGL